MLVVAAQMGAPHPARCRRDAQTSRLRSVRRVGASGGGRVVPASGDDCHTPAPGPRDPSTNHGRPPDPARTRRTGYPRRPGRSGSDCCDTPYHRRSLPETADRQRWPAASDLLKAAAMAVLEDRSWCRRHRHLAVSIATTRYRGSHVVRHASALCARCVRPSFIFEDLNRIGIVGRFVQSLFEVFFFRFRSSRVTDPRA